MVSYAQLRTDGKPGRRSLERGRICAFGAPPIRMTLHACACATCRPYSPQRQQPSSGIMQAMEWKQRMARVEIAGEVRGRSQTFTGPALGESTLTQAQTRRRTHVTAPPCAMQMKSGPPQDGGPLSCLHRNRRGPGLSQ